VGTEYALFDYDAKEYLHLGKEVASNKRDKCFQVSNLKLAKFMIERTGCDLVVCGDNEEWPIDSDNTWVEVGGWDYDNS
jgi:hypothetical protein